MTIDAGPKRWSFPSDERFAALQLLSFAVLLWMGRHLTFIGDEWSFISGRSEWTANAFLLPHNEHLSIGLALIYKTLLSTVGLQSYIPYLMVLFLLHVTCARAIYRYGRAQVGPVFGLAVASVFLFLGSAGEDLFWAFQIGFVGATTFGMWALVLLLEGEGNSNRRAIGTLLLAAAATAGIGLFFLASALAAILFLPNRRRNVWLLIPASSTYAVWYVLFGSRAVQKSLRLGSDLWTYARIGVSTAAGHLTGLGSKAGAVLILLIGLAAIRDLLLRRGTSRRIGLVCGVVGLATQFLLTGAVRAHFGAAQATASRYIYPASAFILIATASWLGSLKPFTPFTRLAGGGFLTLALLSNVAALGRMRDEFVARSQETRAAISILVQYGGQRGVPADLGMTIGGARGYLVPASPKSGAVIPNSLVLREITARAGTPLLDALVPRLAVVPPHALDLILFRIVGDSLTVTPIRSIPEPTVPPAIWPAQKNSQVDAARQGGCLIATSQFPITAVIVSVSPRSTLFLTSSKTGPAQVFLSRWGTFSEQASKVVLFYEGSGVRIDLPDFSGTSPWILRVDPPSRSELRLCVSLPVAAYD